MQQENAARIQPGHSRHRLPARVAAAAASCFDPVLCFPRARAPYSHSLYSYSSCFLHSASCSIIVRVRCPCQSCLLNDS